MTLFTLLSNFFFFLCFRGSSLSVLVVEDEGGRFHFRSKIHVDNIMKLSKMELSFRFNRVPVYEKQSTFKFRSGLSEFDKNSLNRCRILFYILIKNFMFLCVVGFSILSVTDFGLFLMVHTFYPSFHWIILHFLVS